MKALVELGYKRIAYVDTEDSCERSEGMFRGAYHYMMSALFPGVAPQTFVHHSEHKETFFNWYKAHKPDAILSPHYQACRILQEYGVRVPEDCGYLVIDGLQHPTATAIDQCPAQIGAAAVDVLTAHILRNERGVPKHPKTILIEGVLRSGDTTRQKSKHSRAKK
jgi:LacI family transcriptional regulator